MTAHSSSPPSPETVLNAPIEACQWYLQGCWTKISQFSHSWLFYVVFFLCMFFYLLSRFTSIALERHLRRSSMEGLPSQNPPTVPQIRCPMGIGENAYRSPINRSTSLFSVPSCLANWNAIKTDLEMTIEDQFSNGGFVVGKYGNISNDLPVVTAAHCLHVEMEFFQHFLDCLAPFLSIAMLNAEHDNRMQIDYLMFGDDGYWNWYEYREPWVLGFLNGLLPAVQEEAIISMHHCKDTMSYVEFVHKGESVFGGRGQRNWVYNKFFHPSHALRLSSYILRLDPCRYANKAEQLLSSTSPVQLLVVDRERNRRIKNLADIVSELSSKFQHPISVAYTGDFTFTEQARIMEASDVVIAAHGAALINAFFMKPCSVVIECETWMPWGTVYYQQFLNQSMIKRFLITAAEPDMEQISKIENCTNIVRDPAILWDIMDDRWKLWSATVQKCFKSQDVFVNTTRLLSVVSDALKWRRECISNNLYYNMTK